MGPVFLQNPTLAHFVLPTFAHSLYRRTRCPKIDKSEPLNEKNARIRNVRAAGEESWLMSEITILQQVVALQG